VRHTRRLVRTPFLVFLVFAVAAQSVGAAPPTPVRTIKNLPNFPVESLRVGLARPIYRSLSVSPISAWLVARTALAGGKAGGAKITHSEGNGAYDAMLLEMANGYSVTGQNTVESRLQSDSLNVHLLIYDIKDGKMAVCFAHGDDARYLGYTQRGAAWVGVLQGGKWNTISRHDERKWSGR
jgi:hypothetical protein